MDINVGWNLPEGYKSWEFGLQSLCITAWTEMIQTWIKGWINPLDVPGQWPMGCKSAHFQRAATSAYEWMTSGHVVGSPAPQVEPDYCCCWRRIPGGGPRSDLHPQKTAAKLAESAGRELPYHSRDVGRTEQICRLQPLTCKSVTETCTIFNIWQLYLAFDRSKSLVTSMRRPSSLKKRWFPLDIIPHFLEGFPPLKSLKCSASTAPPAHLYRNWGLITIMFYKAVKFKV